MIPETTDNTSPTVAKQNSGSSEQDAEIQAAEAKVREAEKWDKRASAVSKVVLVLYVILTGAAAWSSVWSNKMSGDLRAAEKLLNDLQKEKIRADSLLKTEVEVQKVREEAANDLKLKTEEVRGEATAKIERARGETESKIAEANERAQNLALRIEEEARKRAEAEERLERLRKKAAPRTISKTLEPLEKGAKGRAEILYQDDLPEAYRFACNLRLCLLASGWEVMNPSPILPDPTQPHVPAAEAAGAGDTDVTIRARWLESESETADTPYATLCKFFRANDLGLRCQQDPNLPPDLLRIVIGPKW